MRKLTSAASGAPFHPLGLFRRNNPLSYFLGSSADFSVLGTSIASTGVSSTNLSIGAAKGTIGGGAMGVIPGYILGAPIDVLPPSGIHLETPAATKAIADVAAAYDHFQVYPATGTISGDFIYRVFTPGVYTTVEAISCSGPWYLDAQGDPGSVFVFRIGGAYTPSSQGVCHLLGGARESNIYFLFGGAFSSGAGSEMIGTILTPAAITLGDHCTLRGRALSSGGRVTLANNTIQTN